MAEEIKEVYPDAKVEFIEGSGGIFDVSNDAKMIFCKKKTKENRFPEEGEIASLVKSL